MHRLTHQSQVVILTALLVAGCGAPPSSAPQPTPDVTRPAPKPIEPVELPTAVLPDGFELILELAQTSNEISQGLMFRSHLPENRGMLFLFHTERVPSFWMKNTLIPLDIIFLGPDGTVVDIAVDARPCRAEPCPQYVSKSPARAVLEVGAGVAKAHGIEVGTKLAFNRVSGFPLGAGAPVTE